MPDLETILAGSSARPPDGPNWVLVGCLSSVPVILVTLAWVLARYCKTPERSIWYSAKAKVIAPDTWVEPTTDKTAPESQLRELTFGTVKPRPEGFKILHDDKIVPEALQMDPERFPLDTSNAAWADALANKALRVGIDPGDVHQTPQVIPGTTYTAAGGWRNALMDNEDLNSELSPSLAHTEGRGSHASRPYSNVQSSQAALTCGTPTSRPTSASSRSTRSKNPPSQAGHSTGRSAIEDEELDRPRPPEALVLWQMAEVDTSVTGTALPTVPAPSVAGRPAASARMLRQGVPKFAYVT